MYTGFTVSELSLHVVISNVNAVIGIHSYMVLGVPIVICFISYSVGLP